MTSREIPAETLEAVAGEAARLAGRLGFNPRIERADLEQEGLLAVWRVMVKRGCVHAGYARKIARNAMYEHINGHVRRWGRAGRISRADADAIIARPAAVDEAIDLRAAISARAQSTTRKAALALTHVMLGDPPSAFAEAAGCSLVTARNRIYYERARVREALGEAYADMSRAPIIKHSEHARAKKRHEKVNP